MAVLISKVFLQDLTSPFHFDSTWRRNCVCVGRGCGVGAVSAPVGIRIFLTVVSCHVKSFDVAIWQYNRGVVFTGPKHTVLRFVVKFFPPDHAQLLEELTR